MKNSRVTAEMPKVVYLCDGFGCDKKCQLTSPVCRHTSDITHAINFNRIVEGIDMFEEAEKDFSTEKKE